MPEAPSAAAGRIFVSYRREDTAYAAGWLFNRLADHFGREQLFKDVDSIELGDDFVEVITRAVGSTDVLLALIGDRWLSITDDEGRPRLDNPDDFVRLEIEAALARRVRVIPILVEGAAMPAAEDLPPSLAPLARRQALELSPSRFESDTARLLKVLEKTIAEEREGPGVNGPGRDEDVGEEPVPEGGGQETQAEPGWRRLLAQRRVLVGAGVALAALLGLTGALLAAGGGDETSPQPTETSGAIDFEDDFSTETFEWSGGAYESGEYVLRASKEDGRTDVRASPGTTSSAEDLRIAVDARRTGGTAQLRFGYGLFCRRDGESFYAFNIWNNESSVAKRGPDHRPIPLAEDTPDVTAGFAGEDARRLEAVCTTTTVNGRPAVELRFLVDDEEILHGIDSSDPLLEGTFGLRATLGVETEEPESTLEVTFDDFEVSRN
jgi:TIR domain